MKGFGVESCGATVLAGEDEARKDSELASCTPILEKRPNSSRLRLKKPGDLAAMHIAVGNMLTGC